MDYDEIIRRGNKRMLKEDLEILEGSAIETNPKVMLEIGSMDGCSSMCLGLVARESGGHLYCIEPHPKTRWKVNIKDLGLEQCVTLIMAESPWVDPRFLHAPIDYLLIDGNHRTRWCIVDYHYWERFVRHGGMIAFHDFNARKGVGEWVRRAIDIILEDDKLVEIARNYTKDRGIIVFQKP